MNVQTYLFFEGRCEEAIEFYRRAVGAEVRMLMRNKDSPEPPPADKVAPGSENKVLHAEFTVGESTILASDGYSSGKPAFQGFSLSISVKDVATGEKVFRALSEGGQVTLPLTQTFFSPRFGMLTDRFGVGWMVNVVTPK